MLLKSDEINPKILRQIFYAPERLEFFAVLRIRIQIRIHRIHVFLGLQDPDPDPALDPDPSITMQKL
jgi:hypothetical protein